MLQKSIFHLPLLPLLACFILRICKESYEIVSLSIEMSFFIATEAFRARARARDKYFMQTTLMSKIIEKNIIQGARRSYLREIRKC